MTAACGHCDTCRSPRALFDGTDAAQKALSAIYRTGQMFGARYVVEVLRGEKNDKIENNRHDKLALFGIGRERSSDFWRGVMRASSWWIRKPARSCVAKRVSCCTMTRRLPTHRAGGRRRLPPGTEGLRKAHRQMTACLARCAHGAPK
jgi:hypothetical protein